MTQFEEDRDKVLAKMQELAEDLHKRLSMANLEFRAVEIKIRLQTLSDLYEGTFSAYVCK